MHNIEESNRPGTLYCKAREGTWPISMNKLHLRATLILFYTSEQPLGHPLLQSKREHPDTPKHEQITL
jgi:hypothetical protein